MRLIIFFFFFIVYNSSHAQSDSTIIKIIQQKYIKARLEADSLKIVNTELKLKIERNFKEIENLKKQLEEYKKEFVKMQNNYIELKAIIDRTMNDHLRSSVKFFAVLNNSKSGNIELSEFSNVKGKKIKEFRVIAKGSLSDTDNRKLKVEIIREGDIAPIGVQEGIIQKGEVNFIVPYNVSTKIVKGNYLFIVKVNGDEIYRSLISFN